MTAGSNLYQKILLQRNRIENPNSVDVEREREKERRVQLRQEFISNVNLIRSVRTIKCDADEQETASAPLNAGSAPNLGSAANHGSSPRLGSNHSLPRTRKQKRNDHLKMAAQRRALEGIAMAFRTSKLFKALDKHEASTPQTVKDLLAAGEEANMIDNATGRGFVHKIVEMFEAPREDEFLESQMIPSLISLVSFGANVNLRDTDGNTPLHLAFVLDSGAKVVNTLVKLGADLTILNESGQKVGDLITGSTDPNMVKALGLMVPGLWHAVETDDREKVVSMLQHWSKIDISVDGVSLIDRAKERGNDEIIALLQDHWPVNQLIYAALVQDTKKMKKILKKEKLNLDVKDNSYLDDDGMQVEMTLLGECLMLNMFESAQFLMDKGAFINEPIEVGAEKEPVYFFLMKNNPSLVFSPIFSSLIERADLKLIKRFSVGVFYTGYTNAWPTEIVNQLAENGLDIAGRNEDGYTVRDNILVQLDIKPVSLSSIVIGESKIRRVQLHLFPLRYWLDLVDEADKEVAFYPRKKRLEKLQYVDQHIIKLASDGNLEKLKDIANSGYTNLNIRDARGRPCSYLAKKEGHKQVSEWMDTINEVFKNINTLHEYIRQANLAKAREYLTDETAFVRDRAGRSSLHMAVLFERRFVIKYLLKSYPATVHIKDDNGRTAMHYACALQDGSDIEDLLAQYGADETVQDDLKRCPMDYKLNEDENFIERERKKTCAYDIYLLEVYLNLADGIIEDDFDLVRDTRDDLFEDIKMADIMAKMYKNTTDKPPGFLQLCLDNKRENIARYLINNGVEMWEDVVYDDKVMKFPVAVEKAGMNRLNEFLSKRRREDTDEDAKFKEAEKTIREAKAADTKWNVESNQIEEEEEVKSKACTIL